MWREGMILYYYLYLLKKSLNSTNEAFRFYIQYSEAKDTVSRLQRNRETIELQTRYETERKDQQIATLSLENELKETQLRQNTIFVFGLAGLVFIILLLGYILFRQNRQKTGQQMMILQQKLLRSQMNPHFIFNSLTSIQNYIMDEESYKASKYLSRFSKLVRTILDSSVDDNITIEHEIIAIENYLELQKIRYKSRFDYSLGIDDNIDIENTLIPPMLAQPFIENAIEHGILHKKNKGNIQVRFKSKNEMIILEVEDDGIGRKKAKEIISKQKMKHKSLATTITRERIRVLNKRSRQKITMQIEDLVDARNEPEGTLVRFEIPVIF
jgi:hypothetical protein